MMARRVGLALLGLVAGACGPTILEIESEDDTGTAEGSGGSSPVTSTSSSGPTTPPPDDSGDDPILDFGPGPCSDPLACVPAVDILFVVDNSRSMAEEQRTLARIAPTLVRGLLEPFTGFGEPIDTQVMVTTTDVGNPLCTPFQPPGYQPALGRPTTTSCIDRLDDFVDLTGTITAPEACLDVCSGSMAPPAGILAFGPDGTNVDGPAVDVDGDGELDPPEAHVLACMIPQGINGCGFESPLQAMRLALDPGAPHNQGAQPFLRPHAALFVVLVTDEVDCSVADFSIMEDPSYYEVDPDSGVPAPSSAICWSPTERRSRTSSPTPTPRWVSPSSIDVTWPSCSTWPP